MPYAGQIVQIPCGQGTLTSDSNPSRSRYLDLIVAQGIVSERGMWEREPGAALYPAAAVAGITLNALADYWLNESTQRLLALGSDGKLYKSSGGNFAALTMATTMGSHPGSMIVVGGQESAGRARKAFAFDAGNTRIQTLSGDGATTTDFGGWNTTTNIPADWATNPPRGGVIHKERLWCWAPANAPHNVYASSLTDHENFKNAVGGTLEYVQGIGVGCGLRIAAMASFKGMLFAFKFPRGIYFLDDTDVDFQNWRWNLVSEAIGVADSPFSVIVLDDDILFVSPDGHLQFLSAVTQQGITSSDYTAATNLQEWTRDHINLNRLNQMTSCWYAGKKLAMIGCCSLSATENDTRLMVDFSTAQQDGQVARVSYSFRDKPHVLAVRRDGSSSGLQRPIMSETASGNGQVWLLDQPSKTKAGSTSQARFQYNRTDFSFVDESWSQRRKIFDALSIQFKPVGAWNLSVDTIIDGVYHETLHFGMGGDLSELGAFHLGDRFGGGSVTSARKRMTGHGYWLSLAGYTQSDSQDFLISQLAVNARLGGEEQR